MAGDAMLRNVLLKSLRDQQRPLLWWGLSIVGFSLMMGAFYPSIRAEGEKFQDLVESYPPAFRAFFGDLNDFTTPEGFLSSEMFSFMVPLLFLIYVIGRAADAIAGEEERGSLDVLLAHPVTRTGALLQKAGAVALGALVLGFATWLGLFVAGLLFDMRVPFWNLVSAVLLATLLALTFGALALAVASWRGRKGMAVGVAAGAAAVAFLLDGLAGLTPALEGVEPASPFYWYSRASALRDGLDPASALVLAVVPLALVALSAWLFERRDLGV